jgi:hypothetical protein
VGPGHEVAHVENKSVLAVCERSTSFSVICRIRRRQKSLLELAQTWTRAAILERHLSACDGAKNLRVPIYPGSEVPGAL